MAETTTTSKPTNERLTHRERQINLINDQTRPKTIFIHNSRISRSQVRHLQNIDLLDNIVKNELGYSISTQDVDTWLSAIKELNDKMAEVEQIGAAMLVNSNNATLARIKPLRALVNKHKKSGREEIPAEEND